MMSSSISSAFEQLSQVTHSKRGHMKLKYIDSTELRLSAYQSTSALTSDMSSSTLVFSDCSLSQVPCFFVLHLLCATVFAISKVIDGSVFTYTVCFLRVMMRQV